MRSTRVESGVSWKFEGGEFEFDPRGARGGVIMGILNATPDSFSDGGEFVDVTKAVAYGLEMWEAGARIIDIGGESTRPGAAVVTEAEELSRTLPVIEGILAAEPEVMISIDTSKSEVARQALALGAKIVNDVTGLRGDEQMVEVCAESGCGVVVMHMQGTPRSMQVAPQYDDVVAEVREFFDQQLTRLVARGVVPKALCFDPGIGFGKSYEHNLELLRELEGLAPCGHPLLLGVSRKSFIGTALGEGEMGLRDWPTVALTSMARRAGVMVHRVHRVRENSQALRMIEAVINA